MTKVIFLGSNLIRKHIISAPDDLDHCADDTGLFSLAKNRYMWVLIILGLLFLLMVGFLWMPIEVCLDTVSQQYFVRLKGLVKASLEPHDEELFQVTVHVFFRKFYFYPLEKLFSEQPKKEPSKRQKKKRSAMGYKKIKELLKTFKVKQLLIDIDTGDYVANAKLYPVFVYLNGSVGSFSINFQGRNQMVLFLQNRPIYLLKSFINH
jgi:hypothetical protein